MMLAFKKQGMAGMVVVVVVVVVKEKGLVEVEAVRLIGRLGLVSVAGEKAADRFNCRLRRGSQPILDIQHTFSFLL